MMRSKARPKPKLEYTGWQNLTKQKINTKIGIIYKILCKINKLSPGKKA